jgi:hypothetical protein
VIEQLVNPLGGVLVLEHVFDLVPGHGWRGVAQLRHLLLVDLAVLLGQELGVDERGELTQLHRRALHLAERPGDLQRSL